ncbi:citrate lyase [Actinotalea ferrariae CF5-4]|uniref:Citrate lyase n=1 Tax=Actinotalea ferrariae CF5-4 TaxID=948458 RepID=A0A021VTQ8_9CELL|nr:CoA ester lyase [Actinotalea ferrariae]EYR64513.1 citrate lyase [Actinotalea ferrariae CF5-4]
MTPATTAWTLGPALLFCPADRPDRFAKAAERADAVILDLEDAVAPEAKAAAREALAASTLDPDRTIVRVDAVGSRWFDDDVAALAATGYRTVMLAKASSAEDVAAVRRRGPWDVVALVETAAGVVAAPSIAAADGVVALMWGAEDLVASLGGTSSRHDGGTYRDVARLARASILLAAGAHGRAAIDAVHLDIGDADGLAAEAADARASGFAATACIHPSQVAVVRAAYRPTEAEVDRARRLLEAAAGLEGVFRWEGQMVDGPVLRHAERVLRDAGQG